MEILLRSILNVLRFSLTRVFNCSTRSIFGTLVDRICTAPINCLGQDTGIAYSSRGDARRFRAFRFFLCEAKEYCILMISDANESRQIVKGPFDVFVLAKYCQRYLRLGLNGVCTDDRVMVIIVFASQPVCTIPVLFCTNARSACTVMRESTVSKCTGMYTVAKVIRGTGQTNK